MASIKHHPGYIFALLPALALPIQTWAVAPPNIIHILVDDMGWGDVGFNGQTKIKTPNLDALRASGVAMTTAYCPASVCAPTRASMLTGFHNGHTFVDRNGVDIDTGFRFEDVMIGQVLKQGGYHTGIIGKWGLGASDNGADVVTTPSSLPNNHGYDEFYGYLSHTRAHNYFQPLVWQSNPLAVDGVEAVSTNNTYTHDLFQQRALDYVANNAHTGQPFFLEFAPTIPHEDLSDIAQVPGWDSQYTGGAYSSWTNGQKQYAAMITRMDTGIGQLVAKLNDPDGNPNTADSIANNTLIVFNSDNGPVGPVNFFNSNGPYLGGKRDLTEGGVRTPWIMSWPGVIAPDSTNNQVVDMTDLLPTFAELAHVDETPVGMDGVSFAPLITGQGGLRNRDYWIFEGHESQGGPLGQGPQLWAIRKGNFKLIKWEDGTYRLYNLSSDPTEQTNIVAANASVKAELEAIALAEGVEQDTNFAVTYRTWSGGENANVSSDDNWSGFGTPDNTWSASVENTSSTLLQTARVDTNVSFLGVGVRGVSAPQVLVVSTGATLEGRNEIRVSRGAQLELRGGSLKTNRWVDVRSNGALSGNGSIDGNVFNAGLVTPGVATDAKSVGRIDIFGNFTQLNTGVLALQLGGTQAASGFDQLNITGDATLGGLLNIQLLRGFNLIGGQAFTILDIAGVRSGTFMGLNEGSRIGTFGGTDLFITYLGNGGKDVLLFTSGFGPLGMMPVPEPAAASTISFLALACLRRRARRPSK